MYMFSSSNCVCINCRSNRLCEILYKLYKFICKKLMKFILIIKIKKFMKPLLNDTEYQIKYNTIDESCIICLEKIIVNTKIIRTKCNHHFHTECFEKYLVYNNFNKSGCPICRGELL